MTPNGSEWVGEGMFRQLNHTHVDDCDGQIQTLHRNQRRRNDIHRAGKVWQNLGHSGLWKHHGLNQWQRNRDIAPGRIHTHVQPRYHLPSSVPRRKW